jgi:hypothetical protein
VAGSALCSELYALLPDYPMPFDSTKFRSRNIHVTPPTLQELRHDVRLPPVVPGHRGGGGPRRVHVVIEVRLPAPSYMLGSTRYTRCD